MQFPFVARGVAQLEPWMVADRYRHDIIGQIVDLCFYFEYAIAQTMRHRERVRERKLRHPIRMPPEFELGGRFGAMLIRF